jgi:uncharacterized protein YwgA
MDISMLSKFLKVALNSLILSSICFMQSAYAGFVETPIDPVTFNWSATCYDCNIDDRGIIPNYEDWTEVTGSITLSHYKSGDAIDIENFVSFTYDGLSNHINPFTIGRGPQYSYNLLSIVGTQIDDSLFDLKIEALNDDIPPIEPEYFEILPFDASYQNAVDIADIAFSQCVNNSFYPEVFCQNQTRNLNNATLNLRAHNIAINTINESFKIANDKLEEDYLFKIEALNDGIAPIEPEYFEILPFDASYQNAVDIADIAFSQCVNNSFYPEVFCQNQTRSLFNAKANLKAHNIAINTINESFKIANDKLEEDYNNRILQDLHARMYIDLDADGTWTFQVNDEILDFGIDFNFDGLQVQHSKVSAPPAIVIFALALMGLASRRFKKQS